MSTVSFEIDGIVDLLRALRNLPQDLTDEGETIARAHAVAAVSEIRANYQAHAFTGNLADTVSQQPLPTGRFGAAVLIRARGSHALWFEYGTAARHTSQGAARGLMPAAPPMHRFVPVMERQRRGMYQALRVLLEDHGLEVTGRAD